MIHVVTMIVFFWGCMLDIIWNAVEDEYLTIIMYLLCSIPMRFSGKTSQMIHNKGNHVGGRASCAQSSFARGDFAPGATRCLKGALTNRLGLRRGFLLRSHAYQQTSRWVAFDHTGLPGAVAVSHPRGPSWLHQLGRVRSQPAPVARKSCFPRRRSPPRPPT